MKTFKVDSRFWKRINEKTNIGAFLTHMYGLEKIKDDGNQVSLYMSSKLVGGQKNSYGQAINAVAKVATPIEMLELLDNAYSNQDNIYVFDRFTRDDSDNLVIYPCTTPLMIAKMPEYCETHYAGKYDFEFTVEGGLKSFNAIFYVDKIHELMEDVSFLLLQDADAHGLYEYKIKNNIKLEEYLDYIELKEKELI